jgi:CheY-like chemotaxis protein
MAKYDLERFSILIVEDNLFIRALIANSLKTMGVGRLFTCEDGGEAIEFLKLVKTDPMKAGTMSIDIIVSDWQMSPVDGMMLLRWVRRHKDSTDRFIPFIMITAFSEAERVAEARDLGVTEFLSKPFSIESVWKKILAVIDRPRQFVHTATYFGPDRRRQDLGHEDGERRTLDDRSPEVEIIRG